jgi:hypothetical protein
MSPAESTQPAPAVKLGRFPIRACLLVAILAALLASIGVMSLGGPSVPSTAASRAKPGAHPTVALSTRPAGFWRTAGQALAIAERQPATRRLRERDPHMRVSVFPGIGGTRALGAWSVHYFVPGDPTRPGAVVQRSLPGQDVLIADRSGTVLDNDPWAWSVPWEMGNHYPAWRLRMELISALLALVLLVLLWDVRRPLSLRNLDLVALLSLGFSLALYYQGKVLASVPLQYPPLLYLAGRLVWAGARGTRSREPAAEPAGWASTRTLWLALGALAAARVLYNLLLGGTGDVAFASVIGANGIHHGWPLYWTGSNHLDAYGPAMYLSYLPFELLFPDNGWAWNALPAAHAAAITFDLLTLGGLILLGRRLKDGPVGTRLGVVLAIGWAANPWTLQPLDVSSNDGLIALLLVALLLAASSPWLRGSLLGWAVAAKFAPLALAGLFCFSADRERPARTLVVFGAALALTAGLLVWVFLPAPGGLSLFWARTLGYQMSRHSFMGIWDQYPHLGPLRLLLEAGIAGLAAALLAWPRRRDVYQLAAFLGAIIIGLELTLRFWSFLYIDWFMPAVLVVSLAAPALAGARVPVVARRRPRAAALASHAA